MAPTIVTRSACPRRTSHSLGELTGYVVVRTIGAAGESVDPAGRSRGDVLAVLEGSSRYLEALEVARAHRIPGREYAVVRDLHGCPVCDPIVRAGGEPSLELPA